MTSSVSDGLSGLMEWSEPVIFDRLRDAYREYVVDIGKAARLTKLHARVWRALISGDLELFETLRGDLVIALADQGLDLDCLAEADYRTMRELIEIVLTRFRRSHRTASGYQNALLELAHRLTRARAA